MLGRSSAVVEFQHLLGQQHVVEELMALTTLPFENPLVDYADQNTIDALTMATRGVCQAGAANPPPAVPATAFSRLPCNATLVTPDTNAGHFRAQISDLSHETMQAMAAHHAHNQLQLFAYVQPLGLQIERGMPSCKSLFALFEDNWELLHQASIATEFRPRNSAALCLFDPSTADVLADALCLSLRP